MWNGSWARYWSNLGTNEPDPVWWLTRQTAEQSAAFPLVGRGDAVFSLDVPKRFHLR
jgi:hypothetical protein